jgi:hypothetical protein
MDSVRPFRAFVSYCHKDKAFAAWLQRKLEAYRLPRRLADRVEPLPGQAPGRIGPVFRDREDLSAATDLSAAVREAIAASSALVVVASPDAARSQWVGREIALFRELHPEAPVLVALAAGEPAEALPQTLRTGAEPLCADFRKAGDGKRLAFLKIVAGLARLPLDSLVQRDAQRQVRRVTALTAGAAAMVLVMAALLVMALRAREEAERRRVTADDMIGKLLTEVRGELEGTGNVKLMVAVNQLAMDYYGKQGNVRGLADGSLAQRARVLHTLGQDDEKQSRYDAALARFTEAHRTTAAMLAKSPRHPDAIFAHAQSEYYLGLIAKRRKDRGTAERYWQGYLRQAVALAKAEPGSVRSLLERGYALGNLCDLNLEDNYDLIAAERQCAAAVAVEQQALAKSSELLVALANRYGALALVQYARGRYNEALQSRREEAVLLEPLIAIAPSNVEYALRRCWADIGMASVWAKKGRSDESLAAIRECLERQRSFPGQSDDVRVIETRLRAHLFAIRALRDLGRNDASERVEAARLEKMLEAFGPQYIGKAAAIRAKILSD